MNTRGKYEKDIDYIIGRGWIMHNVELLKKPHMIIALERIQRQDRSCNLMLMLFDMNGIKTMLIDNRLAITDVDTIVNTLVDNVYGDNQKDI